MIKIHLKYSNVDSYPYSHEKTMEALFNPDPIVYSLINNSSDIPDGAVHVDDYNRLKAQFVVAPNDAPLWAMPPAQRFAYFQEYKRQELRYGYRGRKFKVKSGDFLASNSGSGKSKSENLRRAKQEAEALKNLSHKIGRSQVDMTYRKFISEFDDKIKGCQTLAQYLGLAYGERSKRVRRISKHARRKARKAVQLFKLVIGSFMKRGKRQLALKFVKSVLFKISRSKFFRRNKFRYSGPASVFLGGLLASKFLIMLKPRRSGSVIRRLPALVRGFRRSNSMGIKVLFQSVHARSERSMSTRFARELVDVLNRRGSTFRKKDDLYRLGISNKAFAYLLFKKKRKFKGVLRKIRF